MIINPNYKESRTDTHVYFVGGPFSQWYPSRFQQRLVMNGALFTFENCEQYMMMSKALLFGDEAVAAKMAKTSNPKALKDLGREVQGFNEAIWKANARRIVYRANWAKFTQSDYLLNYLLATDDLYIVEGAWYDEVWGVGLSFDDPKILDHVNWKGTNWLGENHMVLRSNIKTNWNPVF